MMEEKIVQAFDEKNTGKAFLCKVDPEERLEANLLTLRKAVENDTTIIFVMVKYPYQKLSSALDRLDVVPETNTFIDAITKKLDMDEQGDDVTYVDSPQNLTNISLSISAVVGKEANQKFLVVIDALDTLLTYNSTNQVSSFLENLGDRINTLDMNAMLFYGTQSDPLTGNVLKHIDNTIILDDEPRDPATITIPEASDSATITLPRDILLEMGWEDGDELTHNITGDQTIELSKK